MSEVSQEFATADYRLFYAYFGLAAIVALYLVTKSKSVYKFELFFLAFYLLTGNINKLLTFSVPGVSFFEIQPDRFLFFILCFFIIRRMISKGIKKPDHASWTLPWFQVMLYLFILFLIVAQISHLKHIGISEVFVPIMEALNIIIIIHAVTIMSSKETFAVIGKAVIIGAIASSIISLIQLGIDPLFMRIGDTRVAFGQVIRSNGIFSTEYFNSYFLITAVAWVLISMNNKIMKYSLVILFSAGVICSFQRMSWIILLLCMVIYLLKIEKIAIGKAVFTGISGLAIALIVVLFFYKDIMNSSMVKERISDSVGGRIGYYTMVFDHIGDKPLFGYGGFENDVYYYSMLEVTGNRKRATGEEGDIHNGYLTALFLYGIPAFICFTIFAIQAMIYFWKLTKYQVFFAIPFFIALLYVVGNLTNNFLFSKYLAVLYAIHLGVGVGARHLPDFYPKLLNRRIATDQMSTFKIK